MKRILSFLLVAFALASCPSRVKDDVLFPPLTLAWPGVEEDIVRGLLDGEADGALAAETRSVLALQAQDLDRAIGGRDEAEARAEWFGTEEGDQPLRPWAERGVQDKLDDGEIGPGVASSLIERIENFNAAIAALPE